MARIVPADPDSIKEAANILKAGGIVAFPTETVYGLGANALDASAVARIFAAKGRPASNPLIVHVGNIHEADRVANLDRRASYLADRFWPGPLTLVLPKLSEVPDIVTAGGSTVGVRAPQHRVAQLLIGLSECPIAAPSANQSEHISPTTAQHVADSLGDAVDLILDGGSCEVGLESTVLDLTVETPRILRPGMISQETIEAALGYRLADRSLIEGIGKSPGQMLRHYAPRHSLWLVRRHEIVAHADDETIATITYSADLPPSSRRVLLPPEPSEYAAKLYAALHTVDALLHIQRIFIELPPESPEWDAITDRLLRAAAVT